MNRLRNGLLFSAVMVAAGLPDRAEAQERPWVADITAGYVLLVDETPDHLFAFGGAIRKLITPRVSIGPELVAMIGNGQGDAPDWLLRLAGNVMFDVYSLQGRDGRRVTPFLVGGVGVVWNRSRFLDRSSLTAATIFAAGGGIRARINERVSAAAEYRFAGYQRFSGSMSIALTDR